MLKGLNTTVQRNVPGVRGTGETAPLYQGQQSELIGATVGIEAVAAAANTTRYLLYGLAGLFVLVVVVAAVGAGYAIADREEHIGPDSPTNYRESANVEFYNYFGGGDYQACSGAFIGSTGQFLTAAHCIVDPFICEFDTDLKRYEIDSLFFVDVMGINGTNEKRTFDSQIVGFSGFADVAIMQALPTAPFSPTGSTPADISISNHPYFGFADSTELERGQTITGMSFADVLLKKLTHEGPVQGVHKDRGNDFQATIEQVFFDGNMREGSSGAVLFNSDMKIVMGPVTYDWEDTLSTSGTSSRVSYQLTKRFLNVDTPPNGPVAGYNKYLIPTMGFFSDAPVGPLQYIGYSSNLDYFTHTQNKGLRINFLYDQAYFEFFTNVVITCGFDPYTVEPPSLLDAPVDETVYGEPPATFPADPSGGDSDVYVIFEAIERTLDRNDWVDVGDDAGTETVSGVMLSSGKWVGDEVRVRIKAFNPYNETSLTQNWQAVYRVTLRAIDPVWDIPFNGDLLSLTHAVHVAPSKLYLNPSVRLPKRLVKHFGTGSGGKIVKTLKRRNGRTVQMEVPQTFSRSLSPIPEGVDINTLPTLAQAFRAYRFGRSAESNADRRVRLHASGAHARSGHRLSPSLDRSRMNSPPPKRYAKHHISENAMKEMNPNHHHQQQQRIRRH